MSAADLMPPRDGSPFDAIMLPGEVWSARDLQPLLGYEKWENFQTAIERAAATATNSCVPDAISRRREMVKQGGATRTDFLLTRFGAYLVAMNGDPRKSEVAAAQAYFAIKTREAEVVALDPRARAELLTRADLARMILESEEEKAVIAAALESAAPAIAYHDRYVANGDAVTVKVWGAQFGLTQPEAFALLLEKKLIYRVSIGERWSESEQRKVTEYEYRAYAKCIDWFDPRPQHNAPRFHNGQVRTTLYVRQQFALQIAGKCGLPMQLRLDGGDAA